MLDNILFKYISSHFCPHDIVSKDYVYDWTNDKCKHYQEFKNACEVCWDCFITEILRDEEEL
jgi:hypothetical protein